MISKFRRKKKKKLKDLDKEINSDDKDKQVNCDSNEAIPKKKRPFFRDKGEKETDEVKGKDNSKFSISLPVNSSITTPELPVLKSSGKGPKIVIAQETKIEPKKTESQKKLSKRKRKHLNAGGTLPEEVVHESKGMGKALRHLKTWKEEASECRGNIARRSCPR